MTEKPKELWSINDFRKAHGNLSRAYVYELLQNGTISGVKIGKLTLITEASRQEWLRSLPKFRSSAAVRNRPIADPDPETDADIAREILRYYKRDDEQPQ